MAGDGDCGGAARLLACTLSTPNATTARTKPSVHLLRPTAAALPGLAGTQTAEELRPEPNYLDIRYYRIPGR